MQLCEALAIRPGEVVSIVGAGGKTTLAMRLMAELAAAGQAVVFTTTTKILEPVLADDERLVLSDRADTVLQLVPEWLASYRKIFLAAARLAESTPVPADYPFPVRPHKLQGVPPDMVDALAAALPAVVIVNEADGARHRWLKAPAGHEPVVPGATTLLVPVANLAVLGRPLDEASVFRPERVAALSGTVIGQPVTAETVAATLAHPQGGLKGAPPGARVAAVLDAGPNGGGAESRRAAGREVAGRLLDSGRVERVVVAALRQPEAVLEVVTRPHVAAIVLAAGGSRRMGGRPKQLLPVGGQPMLRRVLEAVRASPVEETVVVLGYRAEEVRDGSQIADCKVVVNEGWAEGLSSSVRAGLDAISPQAEAALFVLADQPGLTAGVIAALIARYRRTRAPIVVPVCRGRRGNPVLFDRALFDRLRQVQGDAGGRQLIAELGAAVETVEVDDERVLWDVDTPDDWAKASESVDRA